MTVLATPAAGYSFVNWTESGTFQSASSNYTFGVTRDQRRRLLLEGGLRIHTTLDPHLQALAEQSAARVISGVAFISAFIAFVPAFISDLVSRLSYGGLQDGPCRHCDETQTAAVPATAAE